MGTDFVTQLTPIGKTRTRVCLNEEQTLVLSNREIVQYGIREGEELPQETKAALEKTLYQKAIRKCGELLEGMSYTEKGLTDRLIRAGYPEQTARKAVEAMKQAHYVDDRAYAEAYLRSNHSKKSKRRVEQELENKGVARELIPEILAAWEEESGCSSEESEMQQIREFLRKKDFDPAVQDWESRQKMMAKLARKGYSFAVLEEALHP